MLALPRTGDRALSPCGPRQSATLVHREERSSHDIRQNVCCDIKSNPSSYFLQRVTIENSPDDTNDELLGVLIRVR